MPVQSATTPVQSTTTPIIPLITPEQSAAITQDNGSTETSVPMVAGPSADRNVESSKYYWPDLLKEDIPNARIFTFGYDADVISITGGVSMDRLAVHASNLVGELHRVRKTEIQKARKIIFIAHSLGGLVVKRAIQDSADSSVAKLRRVEEATAGIVFLGTPHSGSDLAPFATAIGSLLKFFRKRVNDDLLSVLQRDSPVLLDLEKWFGQ
ncbi:uncharacterized protein N0V89_003441 [Didymosphaeria variabile]|uniref:DUF676 domain-containing protein n=1 Tax=Didymosphaeria variabile TaxID=1932322 RepID=A0A9W8XMM9_9PLEO|nr:uncharacterized protein N0V89_003441 [Didymosphaeria variabile]KAJ4355425.1 hypothetical protein N0V89_003441 [Didymosphaeria variabile]